MNGRGTRIGFTGVLLCLAVALGVMAPAQPATAFDKTWFDAGCSVPGLSHGLLDGLSIGSGGEAGSFWMNPVSSANESCAYEAGVGEWMSAKGAMSVRVKIDPRVRFQLAAFGTQGDIPCAKPLGMITSAYDDGAFHTLSVPLAKGVWVDCVRMVLDDDPNTSPPGREYPFALIDHVRIRTGRHTVWSESFSD
jgi:hypothetical protein